MPFDELNSYYFKKDQSVCVQMSSFCKLNADLSESVSEACKRLEGHCFVSQVAFHLTHAKVHPASQMRMANFVEEIKKKSLWTIISIFFPFIDTSKRLCFLGLKLKFIALELKKRILKEAAHLAFL